MEKQMKNVKRGLFLSGLLVVVLSAFDVWSAITPLDETIYVTQQRSMSGFEQNQNGNTEITCPADINSCNYADDAGGYVNSVDCCYYGTFGSYGTECDETYYPYIYRTKDDLSKYGLIDDDGYLSNQCCHSYFMDRSNNVTSESWYCSKAPYPKCSSAIADLNYRDLLDIFHPSSCDSSLCDIAEGKYSGQCISKNNV